MCYGNSNSNNSSCGSFWNSASSVRDHFQSQSILCQAIQPILLLDRLLSNIFFKTRTLKTGIKQIITLKHGLRTYFFSVIPMSWYMAGGEGNPGVGSHSRLRKWAIILSPLLSASSDHTEVNGVLHRCSVFSCRSESIFVFMTSQLQLLRPHYFTCSESSKTGWKRSYKLDADLLLFLTLLDSPPPGRYPEME